jgi:hypothetical protein
MQIKLALVSVALFVLIVAPAVCQSNLRAQQQAACEDDAYRLCPNEVPDEALIANCLARQKASLSPACRAQFTSSPRRRRGR